ncbi:LOW QUALITY PROTEIN: putative multidrug resistance-associated protein lethal(2)03659 isoform X1 [Vespula maculifrons]|uniref:Multidrug resistance-associated protein lethal(2)03659 isoform X1 n=1 Tax=Vespula maculifrons TaxID=7453 RepID=A0ABD2D442_VESMC
MMQMKQSEHRKIDITAGRLHYIKVELLSARCLWRLFCIIFSIRFFLHQLELLVIVWINLIISLNLLIDQGHCFVFLHIGVREISLSSDQRAHINLTRVVYTNMNIYILKNPLLAKFSDASTAISIMHSGLIQAKSDFNTSEISEVEQICGGEDISEKELEKKEKSMEDSRGRTNENMDEILLKVLEAVYVTEIRTIAHVSIKAYVSYFKTKVSVLLLLLVTLLLFSSFIRSTLRKR